MPSPVAATVIVPVHNGSPVLDATIDSFLSQIGRARIRFLFVCNGCRDESPELIRRRLPEFRAAGRECIVLEVARGSRMAALNLGDLYAHGARIYADQDVILPDAGSFAALIDALGRGWHFTTLRPEIRGRVSLAVRLYFNAWRATDYVRKSPVTTGLYAVSAAGRKRWLEFPDLHSDDKFARLHFSIRERRRIDELAYLVEMPCNLAGLVGARMRYAAGNRELARAWPALRKSDMHRCAGAWRLLARPALWLGCLIVLCIELFIVFSRWGTLIRRWCGQVLLSAMN